MEITNLGWNDSNAKQRNNELLPNSIRGLIIGKSGCGKTTLLLNLLLKDDWLDYDHLYVFGKSLYQPEYKILQRGFENGLKKCDILETFKDKDEIIKRGIDAFEYVDCVATQKKCKGEIVAKFFSDGSDVPDPSDLRSNNMNLIIFDDLMLEKQNHCEAFYTRGRHNNVDCFYISQNYFHLPRQTIRENANFICLFKQDARNIDHIHRDHCSDITKNEFAEFCNQGWETRYGFIVIDLTSKKNNGKYRHSFDTFYFPRS